MTYTVVKTYPTLYKRDSKGKVREWHMEIGRDDTTDHTYNIHAHRAVTGLQDGKKIESGWKATKGKNVGKANATTCLTQAEAEIEALYVRQKDSGYFEDISLIDTYSTFEPMLAEKYPDAVKKKKLPRRMFAQPKLDGIRCNVMIDPHSDVDAIAMSRAAKPFVTVQHVIDLLIPALVKNPNLVFDGELYNHELKEDFNQIASLVRKTKPTPEDIAESVEKVQYHVYDLFDPDQPDAPFEQRSKWLKTIVEDINNPSIVFVETVEADNKDHLDDLYAKWLEEGYEGQMVRANTEYEQDRTWALLKRKEFITDEFEVAEVVEGKGNWAGTVKRFTLKIGDETFGAGVRGKKAVLKSLFEGPKPDWATVRYFEPPVDSLPRFGVVVDWGWGKRND